jgi:hypothetical protein
MHEFTEFKQNLKVGASDKKAHNISELHLDIAGEIFKILSCTWILKPQYIMESFQLE